LPSPTDLFTRTLLSVAVVTAACAPATRRADPVGAEARPIVWRAPEVARQESIPPRPPFRFVEEDFAGDSPKFTVVDANDREWRVKLGPEVHTEIPAAVLLSGTGYFVDDMHYVQRARIEGIERLRRGRQYLQDDGSVTDAQFEARSPDVKRTMSWDWADNPFVRTEPLDGLRVLMLLINNYDARAENNRISEVDSERFGREARYMVSDLGASFGRYGGLGGRRTKGDLAGYRASRFVDRVEGGQVLFAYRTRPQGWGLAMFVLNPFYALGEVKKQRDLDRVPLPAVRWIVQRLQQMAPGAIRAGFDSAGLSPADAEGFTQAVEERIRALAVL
jgi:hypothetical protein